MHIQEPQNCIWDKSNYLGGSFFYLWGRKNYLWGKSNYIRGKSNHLRRGNQIISEMDKASSLFQHQAQKAALPYAIHVFSRTRARITRAYYTIIPRFLPSLPSPSTEKHLTTAWFAFTALLFTSTLHFFPSPLPSPLFPWFSIPLPHRWRSEGNLYTLYSCIRTCARRRRNRRNESPIRERGGRRNRKKEGEAQKMGTLRLTTEHSLTELIKDEKTISS